MRRRITVAVLALCALMAIGAPILHAAAPKQAHTLEAKYKTLRAKVVHEHGKRAPGRNIVRDGVRTKHGTRAARKAEIAKSITVFRNILSPPAPPATSQSAVSSSGLQSTASPTASPTVTYPESGGNANAVAQCESGGDYQTNTGNGYYGAYQFDDQTWAAAGGSGHASDAPPSEQDARFHSWYGGHPGAWPVCGK